MSEQPSPENDAVYPMLVGGRWMMSPLAHLGMYADRASRDSESHVAVPRDLLLRVAGWRECGERRTFTSDEDGVLREPIEAACRNERGHDRPGLPDHVRTHSNGYYHWPAEHIIPPGEGQR